MAVNTMGGAVVCVAMCIHKVQVLCCVCCVGPTVICIVAMAATTGPISSNNYQ